MRCYIPPAQWSAGELVVEGEEMHHLVRVMRAKAGQQVRVFDGEGREADADVRELSRRTVVLHVQQQFVRPRPALRLSLIQAVPREQKMDLILQKATELGITDIYPVLTDHGVVRPQEGRLEAKQERWDKIVLNAAKQCGVAWLPRVHAMQAFRDLIPALPRFDLLLTCSLEPDAEPLRAVVDQARPRKPLNLCFLVGPEGDFSLRENAAARQAGSRPVSLGDLVLRTETATLYVLSILRYEFGGSPD